MLEVQERVIRPIVGEEAFEQMKSGTIPEKLSEQFAAAKLCIPLYAIITAVKRMSVKVLPSMIVRRFSDSFQGGRGGDIDDSTTRKFLHTLQQEALDAKTELQKAVTDRRNPARDVALIPNNDPTKNSVRPDESHRNTRSWSCSGHTGFLCRNDPAAIILCHATIRSAPVWTHNTRGMPGTRALQIGRNQAHDLQHRLGSAFIQQLRVSDLKKSLLWPKNFSDSFFRRCR